MKTDPDALRRIVEKALLDYRPDDPNDQSFSIFYPKVVDTAHSQNITVEPKVIIEHWWHLARVGIIAMTGHPKGTVSASAAYSRPNFVVTDRGRTLLEHGQESPHDPQRYIEAIKRRVSTPDSIAITYVDEAVGAWAAGLYRSSAVMLGCACERLIDMLAEAVASKSMPKSGKLKAKLTDPTAGISGIFEDVRISLKDSVPNLPHKLKDQIDRKLSAIFDHARMLRNKSGHPTGEAVTAEDAEAGLLMFPGFYALADQFIQFLSQMP